MVWHLQGKILVKYIIELWIYIFVLCIKEVWFGSKKKLHLLLFFVAHGELSKEPTVEAQIFVSHLYLLRCFIESGHALWGAISRDLGLLIVYMCLCMCVSKRDIFFLAGESMHMCKELHTRSRSIMNKIDAYTCGAWSDPWTPRSLSWEKWIKYQAVRRKKECHFFLDFYLSTQKWRLGKNFCRLCDRNSL